jgi:hypothetical protein
MTENISYCDISEFLVSHDPRIKKAARVGKKAWGEPTIWQGAGPGPASGIEAARLWKG